MHARASIFDTIYVVDLETIRTLWCMLLRVSTFFCVCVGTCFSESALQFCCLLGFYQNFLVEGVLEKGAFYFFFVLFRISIK